MLLFWLFRLTWCPINRRRHLSRFYGYTNWLPPAFTVCVISWLVYSIAGPIKRGPLLIFIRFFFLPCFFLFYLLCVVHCAIEGGGPSRNPGRWNHFWKRNTENHPEMFQEEKRATRNLPWRYVEIIFYFIDYSTMWELRLLLVVLGAVLLFPEAEIFRSENLFLAWELLLSTPIFVLFFDKTGLFDQRPAHHSIFSQFL